MSRGKSAKTERGRTATPPAVVPELHRDAAVLLTEEGLCNALADLYERMKCGGTRDEVSAMIGEKHVLLAFRDIQADRSELRDTRELAKELRETRRLMKATIGAKTSFDDAPALPEKGGPGAN